jgi:hypothetical protein
MSDEQDKFIHSANIKNYSQRLTVETDVHQRDVLTKLLAEEIATPSVPTKWN